MGDALKVALVINDLVEPLSVFRNRLVHVCRNQRRRLLCLWVDVVDCRGRARGADRRGVRGTGGRPVFVRAGEDASPLHSRFEFSEKESTVILWRSDTAMRAASVDQSG